MSIMKEFPKIIWQHHKWEYEDLPDLYKRTSQTWQAMNPDWEYRYVSDKEIRNEIKKLNNNALLECFDIQQTGMAKADVYREAMIYEYGGLWADLDSVCLFPIDKVIKNNVDKDMICISPWTKYGMDIEDNYKEESFDKSIDKLMNGIESGYWISNAVFLGKKHNIVSEEIMKAMTVKWDFKEFSFMGMRSELYDKYHDQMSLDLHCAFHDGRFNLRNYPDQQ